MQRPLYGVRGTEHLFKRHAKEVVADSLYSWGARPFCAINSS